MNRLVTMFLFGVTAVFFTSACLPNNQAPTPTPFSSITSSATPNISAAEPFPVNFEDLVTNPITYEGAQIQLTGRYRKLPILICDGKAFISPATWTLVSSSFIAPLGGFETQVNQLLPEDTTMTINGIWRRWQGPIGCGKEAISRDIWYLDVQEIVSPNPIVRVTLTPLGEEVSDSGDNPSALVTQPPVEQVEPPSDPTLETQPVIGEATSTQPPTFTPAPGGNVATPTALPTSTPSDDEEDSSEEATAVPTATESATNDDDDPTPEATSSSENPTPTATSSDPNLIMPTPVSSNNGTLLADDLGFSTLQAGTIHQWNINLVEGTAVTITVGMEESVNPIITLIDPLDNIIVDNQDLNKAGEFESIQNLAISNSGFYQLLIRSEGDVQSDYVVNYFDTDSLPFFSFEGFLNDDDSFSEMVEEDEDDYWMIYAEQGEIISITVVPTTNETDLFLTLWGEDGNVAMSADDDPEEEGMLVTEIIEDFEILRTGFYTLQIGEWDFQPANYSLTFERQ